MESIVFNGEVINPTTLDCPLFIHGADGSGASFFTIVLAAQLVSSGEKVLFFCAKEQGGIKLLELLGDHYQQSLLSIPKPGDEEGLLESLRSQSEKGWVIVKNMENWSQELLEEVKALPLLILSGDFDKSRSTNLLSTPQSKILFSPSGFMREELPQLDKYEGLLITETSKGIIKLQV